MGSRSPAPDSSLIEGDRVLDLVGVVLIVAILGALVLIGALVVGGGIQGGPDAPDADWRFERINGTHARIVHAGGDPVESSTLVVTADGRKRHPTWSAEVLTEGDSGTFRATTARSVVRLFWEGEEDRELLASWRLR